MKESSNLYRIQDILNLIEQTDKMITLHSKEGTVFMREQYEYRKEKFLKELLHELTNTKSQAVNSFGGMLMELKKFYPELVKLAKKEHVKKENRRELTKIGTALAA